MPAGRKSDLGFFFGQSVNPIVDDDLLSGDREPAPVVRVQIEDIDAGFWDPDRSLEPQREFVLVPGHGDVGPAGRARPRRGERRQVRELVEAPLEIFVGQPLGRRSGFRGDRLRPLERPAFDEAGDPV